MRCLSCNVNLSDAESVFKSEVSGEYFDMCFHCLSTIDVGYSEDLPIVEETKSIEDGDLLTP